LIYQASKRILIKLSTGAQKYTRTSAEHFMLVDISPQSTVLNDAQIELNQLLNTGQYEAVFALRQHDINTYGGVDENVVSLGALENKTCKICLLV
jgi:hypothetical protein